MAIHPTSIVSTEAKIDKNANIGPFCTIGANVTVKANVNIISHTVIEGITEIGEGTTVYPFTTIGMINQDLKYKNEPTETIIGKNNTIRESVTIHRGTVTGISKTVIGDNNLLMVGVHVAHDCVIGNNCIIANNCGLAGHVELGNNVVIGGQSGLRQFVKIGSYAMIGAKSKINKDVYPYSIVDKSEDTIWRGLNIRGLKRHDFSKDDIKLITQVFDELFDDNNTFIENKKTIFEKYKNNEIVSVIIDFLSKESSLGGYGAKQ